MTDKQHLLQQANENEKNWRLRERQTTTATNLPILLPIPTATNIAANINC
jgi:hypothetical protein